MWIVFRLTAETRHHGDASGLESDGGLTKLSADWSSLRQWPSETPVFKLVQADTPPLPPLPSPHLSGQARGRRRWSVSDSPSRAVEVYAQFVTLCP